ncbi:MAG TPA: FAD/NAD(P)-binding oxidoreductase [Pyrinomonadaceae bacterium]|nr:FAD/NAD(P)-binding oxidoreductase [Pyrinomonadaceae bacterium]
MRDVAAEVVVVGAGPAGLAAASAASRYTHVTIVDDNPKVGGQIWRVELGKNRSPHAKQFIESLDAGNITLLNNAAVFSIDGERKLSVNCPDGTIEIGWEKLIIATGARERFLPFPGWTLPNVMGAGGLQAMVKGGLKVSGKRVVVAGTGPLLIAVAEYLKRKGAVIAAIAEQAAASKVNRFGFGLIASPSKLKQAIALKAKLLGVRYMTDCWVTSANGDGRLESVTLTRRGKTWSVDCDFLACGYHLVPNLELAMMLGCNIADGSVAVDELQDTSIENVYCAGEPTGIAGVDSAVVEGTIAGLAATGEIGAARKLFAKRDKARRFGEAMNRAFELRDELRSLARDETIVCRCEDVEYGRLTEFDNFREAKLQTRCGMGPCQGRVCGAATEFLFGWERPIVRPPIFPVKIGDL